MQPIEITLEEQPAKADIDQLRAGLTAHALPVTGRPGFLPLATLARDASGKLIGGAYGTVNWNWLDLSLFWVAESHRGAGLGSKLIKMLEGEGLQRGCQNVHLVTFSYQAAELYQRHGYQLFATLEDYPPGQQRMYFRKRLVDSDIT